MKSITKYYREGNTIVRETEMDAARKFSTVQDIIDGIFSKNRPPRVKVRTIYRTTDINKVTKNRFTL